LDCLKKMNGKIGVSPLVLVSLDGWGISAEREANALAHARTPIYDRLAGTYPHTILTAAGPAIGLPLGKPGNQQAGYMAMGAGRPLEQDITRINRAIQDAGPHGLAANPVLAKIIHRVRSLGGAVHLIGLVSPGGVAGHQNHLAVLAALLSHEGIKVFIHGIMDGIDVAPQSGIACLTELLDDIAGAENARLASVMGRGLALDETADPASLKLALKAIVDADMPRTEYLSAHVDQCYTKKLDDDRITPAIAQNYHGLRRDDAVVLVNLRPDLGAALMQALLTSETGGLLSAAHSLVALDGEGLESVEPLFARLDTPGTFAETVSQAGLTQLLLTETVAEKNLSNFWRGGGPRLFRGETLALAETPPLVKMERRPELAAADLTIEAMNAIKKADRDFLMVNFANVAIVGRSGNMRATIEAAEAIDKFLGKIAAQVEKRGGTMVITSAFGRGEKMADLETGAQWRGPTSSNMPFTLVSPVLARNPHKRLRFGTLADVAPTLLDLMSIKRPASMTGTTLLAEPEMNSLERPDSVSA